jgi:hypothetical protein
MYVRAIWRPPRGRRRARGGEGTGAGGAASAAEAEGRGDVQRKMRAGEYQSPVEFEHDMMLVWHNCMLYNQDGSDYYILAEKLLKEFRHMFAAVKAGSADKVGATAKPPTIADKRVFTQNVYAITAEELGKFVQLLDSRCSGAIRKVDADDIEVDVDSIDPETFWVVDEFTKACVANGAKKASGARKGRPPGAAGAAAAAAAAAAAPRKPKPAGAP